MLWSSATAPCLLPMFVITYCSFCWQAADVALVQPLEGLTWPSGKNWDAMTLLLWNSSVHRVCYMQRFPEQRMRSHWTADLDVPYVEVSLLHTHKLPSDFALTSSGISHCSLVGTGMPKWISPLQCPSSVYPSSRQSESMTFWREKHTHHYKHCRLIIALFQQLLNS